MFTGREKLMDTGGRVEKFERKYAKKQSQESTDKQDVKQIRKTEKVTRAKK